MSDTSDIGILIQGLSNAGSNSFGAIGIPDGYTAPINSDTGFSPGSGPAITVRDYRENPYMEGDDWRPSSLPPEQIASIQQQLREAGLLDGSYRVGVWDSTTRDAYRQILAYANSLGTTDEFALRRWLSTGMGQQKAQSQRAPLIARVTNPEDIKAGLRSTFRDLLGLGAIDESRLDAMVKAYQGEEVSAQKAEYNAVTAGGTVAAPPDFQVWAEKQAQIANPVAYDSHKVLEKFNVLRQILSGQST